MMTTDTANLPIVAERCDRCNAQAKVKATLVNGELFFCGHHAREAGVSLLSKALEVYDPESLLDGR